MKVAGERLAYMVAPKSPGKPFRYVRRVPTKLQKTLRRKQWNLSLGKNFLDAQAKAKEYVAEHDELIASLRDPESAGRVTRELATERASARIAALEKADAPDAVEGEQGTVTEALQEQWRRIPDVLRSARGKANEYVRLAAIQVMAFGDRSRGTMDAPTTTPPTDPVDLMLYDAHRAMLATRLEELAPLPDESDPEMRLTALLEKYILSQGVRPTTRRGYENKVKRFAAFAGDRELQTYTADDMRNYRDHLLAGDASHKPVKVATIHQYFAPLKALWRWVPDEYDELRDLTFPRSRLPKIVETVEETRWQAFDETEMKEVWRLLNAAWGPDVETRMTPRRRRDYLMAVRMMLYTGMRPAEVFRITAADIKDGTITIRRTKTTPRKLPLSDHLHDLPTFLEEGGFQDLPQTISTKFADRFVKIIRPHFPNDRHVLYSLKDTLIDRLQRQGVSDDVMRGIIGHVSGQGKLRHYKTPFGDTEHGRAAMKAALDQIRYW